MIKAAYDQQNEMLTVHVVDGGRGIKQEDMRKLFKLFGKLGGSDDEMNPDGIGMGLNICRKIVTNNGGSIDVFSGGLNKGSTFMFTMKMACPN